MGGGDKLRKRDTEICITFSRKDRRELGMRERNVDKSNEMNIQPE